MRPKEAEAAFKEASPRGCSQTWSNSEEEEEEEEKEEEQEEDFRSCSSADDDEEGTATTPDAAKPQVAHSPAAAPAGGEISGEAWVQTILLCLFPEATASNATKAEEKKGSVMMKKKKKREKEKRNKARAAAAAAARGRPRRGE